jgi:hypothetical protein
MCNVCEDVLARVEKGDSYSTTWANPWQLPSAWVYMESN